MVEPFGDQDKDEGLGKRPSHTIEGKATEISVEGEPAREAAAADEASTENPSDGEPAAEPAGDGPVEDRAGADEPPPRTSPSELKGFFTHLAAGLLGGLIGVLGLALAWGLFAPRSEGPSLVAVEQRLGKLESAPASPGDAKALASLSQRVQALEARKPVPQQDLSEVMARVSKLQASLETLAKAGGDGGPVADAAALDARMGDIERRLEGKIGSALEAQDAAQGQGFETIEAEIAQLRAKLGALAEAKLDPQEGDSSPEVVALDERIAALETALPRLASAVDRGAVSAKSGAATIALANLREAVDSGRAYAPELAAFNALAPQSGDLGVLPSRADSGIPTAAALSANLQALESAAPAPGTADASFIDSVIASAKSAVRIRRLDADPASSSEPDAVVARAEAKIASGDLAGAVKDIETLPVAVRDVLSPWLENARARLAADETLARLQATLLSSLSGEAGEAKP